jgi:hypothetical protein
MNEKEYAEQIAFVNQMFIVQIEEIRVKYWSTIFNIRDAYLKSTIGRSGKTPGTPLPLVQP